MPSEQPVGTGVSWGNTSALPSQQAEEPLQEVTLTLPAVKGQSWDLDGASPALRRQPCRQEPGRAGEEKPVQPPGFSDL